MAMSKELSDQITDLTELVCRGCLKEWGEMKNIFQCGLDVDFFEYAGVPNKRSEDLPELICANCEKDLLIAKNFRLQCQQTDKLLMLDVRKKLRKRRENKCRVLTIRQQNKIVLMITAPNPDDQILFRCPNQPCDVVFQKKDCLYTHLIKTHGASENVTIEQQFYCAERGCTYNMVSGSRKFFRGRKYLNQHHNKTHKAKVFQCYGCPRKFSIESDLYRHSKDCKTVYVCPLCPKSYSKYETYLVHLLRNHPKYHAKYKEDRKAKKRSSEDTAEIVSIPKPDKFKWTNVKKTKTDEVLKEPIPEVQDVIDTNAQAAQQPIVIKLQRLPTGSETVVPLVDTSLENMLTYTIYEETALSNSIYKEKTTELSNTEDCFGNESGVKETTVIEEGIDEECFGDIAEDHIIEVAIDNGADTENDSCYIDVNPIAVDTASEIKKSSATQSDNITNDVHFNSWPSKNSCEIQRDENSTQTVFGDLLCTKSQQSEDSIFFPESVSLTDIHTQTEYKLLEFGLSRCNKETQACPSPDLSIKETQTCYCLYDSPKMNFKLFDSLSSSPASSNFISTETQTATQYVPIHSDVLLSFNSAETQTCFDDSSNGSM